MKREIHHATPEEHQLVIAVMQEFLDDFNTPFVGLFWLNPKAMSLFGVRKTLCPEYMQDETVMMDLKEFHDYWEKQHQIAVKRNDGSSIFFDVDSYKKMPRGAIVCEHGTFVAITGDWIKSVNKTRLTELLEDEFNLLGISLTYRMFQQLNLGYDWPENIY